MRHPYRLNRVAIVLAHVSPVICFLALGFLLPGSAAIAGELVIPATPALTDAEIIQLLDGKTFTFTAYDQPLIGLTVWNYPDHTVSGSYLYDGTPGTFTATWTVTDNKSCTQAPGQDRICQTIYVYQTGFMEVNAAGQIHAVSVPK